MRSSFFLRRHSNNFRIIFISRCGELRRIFDATDISGQPRNSGSASYGGFCCVHGRQVPLCGEPCSPVQWPYTPCSRRCLLRKFWSSIFIDFRDEYFKKIRPKYISSWLTCCKIAMTKQCVAPRHYIKEWDLLSLICKGKPNSSGVGMILESAEEQSGLWLSLAERCRCGKAHGGCYSFGVRQ